MPDCRSVTFETIPFWGPKGLGATGPEAYDAAKLRLRHQVARWARQWKAEASCPQGCDGPYHFQYSIEEIRVYGRPDRGDSYAIWIQARVHRTWDCYAVETTPPPEPVHQLPGTAGSEPSEAAPPPVEEDTGPCTVTLTDQDRSEQIGIGVFDWQIDLEFRATASNSSHDFRPGSCRIVELRLRDRGGLGGLFPNAGPLGGVFDAIDDAVAASWDLKDAGYGLDIQEGAGEASVSGRLIRQAGMPLDATSHVSLRVVVEVTDDHGDTTTETFEYEPR